VFTARYELNLYIHSRFMSDFKRLSNVFTVYSLQTDDTKFPIIISAILFSVVLLQNSRCQQLDSFYCDTVSMT